jgi:hypothetical protein
MVLSWGQVHASLIFVSLSHSFNNYLGFLIIRFCSGGWRQEGDKVWPHHLVLCLGECLQNDSGLLESPGVSLHLSGVGWNTVEETRPSSAGLSRSAEGSSPYSVPPGQWGRVAQAFCKQ